MRRAVLRIDVSGVYEVERGTWLTPDHQYIWARL